MRSPPLPPSAQPAASLTDFRDAQAAQGQPAAKQRSGEQLKRADAVQESLSKIAQDHAKDVDVAGTLVQRVKADDAKVLFPSPLFQAPSL
jgi:type II secretory pathway component HofQ